jgi:hypothetical protein
MKKMLIAAAAVALFSAPAFAAPEPYNLEVSSNGTFRSSPPSNMEAAPARQAQPGQATWTRAESPSTQNSSAKAEMIQASDDQGSMKPKKKHHKKKAAAPSSEAPKAAPAGQPAGQQ